MTSNYFQIRSAFALAFTTLTNPKVILGLGPNRSILGTIIRPDPVLLKRKGGSNGDVTFNNLLPGAGYPLQQQYGSHHDMLCNWQLDYEESLPWGFDGNEESSTHSLGKKRQVSNREKSSKKKVKENGEVKMVRNEENASRKEKPINKKHWRHNQ